MFHNEKVWQGLYKSENLEAPDSAISMWKIAWFIHPRLHRTTLSARKSCLLAWNFSSRVILQSYTRASLMKLILTYLRDLALIILFIFNQWLLFDKVQKTGQKWKWNWVTFIRTCFWHVKCDRHIHGCTICIFLHFWNYRNATCQVPLS